MKIWDFTAAVWATTHDVINLVLFTFLRSECRFVVLDGGVDPGMPNVANEDNPQFCLFCLQSLAGGHRWRSHGDGPTAASPGVGVSDLRGRSCLSQRTKHGGAAVPLQTGRQPGPQLQVSHPDFTLSPQSFSDFDHFSPFIWQCRQTWHMGKETTPLQLVKGKVHTKMKIHYRRATPEDGKSGEVS